MARCYGMLGGPGPPPEIRRGRGMRLSIKPVEATDAAQDDANNAVQLNVPKTHNRMIASV